MPDLLTRPPAWLVVAAVVVVAAVGWWWMRRPAPAEDRLPRAVASAGIGPAPTSVAATGSGSAPLPVPAGPGSGAGVGSSAAGTAGGPVTVHVAGAVVRPGVVTVADGGRVVDAVQAAGGMAAGADPDRVNLAARLVDGERVVVPFVGQPVPAPVTAEVPAVTGRSDAGGPGAASGGLVDLNRATAEELDALPGVGPSTATAIIAHRESQGPFRTLEDLLDVRGIGDARLENLRPLVTVG